jgi:hypothetical protein
VIAAFDAPKGKIVAINPTANQHAESVGRASSQGLKLVGNALLRQSEMTNMRWGRDQNRKHHTGIGGTVGA